MQSATFVAEEASDETRAPEGVDGWMRVDSERLQVAFLGFDRDVTDSCEFFRFRVHTGSSNYELRRRYSQFEALSRSMRVAGRLHSLPPKFLLRHTDENVSTRGAALEAWLLALLADASCGSDVERYLKPFLELDAATALEDQRLRDEHAHSTTLADIQSRQESMSDELLARRVRSAEKGTKVTALEAERAALLDQLGDKASEVKRLEHGMSTAKALVARLRAQLLDAERAHKKTAPAPASADGANADAEAEHSSEHLALDSAVAEPQPQPLQQQQPTPLLVIMRPMQPHSQQTLLAPAAECGMPGKGAAAKGTKGTKPRKGKGAAAAKQNVPPQPILSH